uniref:Uncharacterized protein n=1 Tax=Acrobeloides nanus TaxID=290746 RepID=A0A914DQV7_9BILA
MIYDNFSFFVFILTTCLVSKVLALNEFDTTSALTVAQFECLKKQGFVAFMGRVYDPIGDFDEVGIQNMHNAHQGK